MNGTFNTRLSRRTFLRGSALGGVGLATAAVIGCDDDDDDDDDAVTKPPAAGGGSTGAPASGGGSTPAEVVKSATLTDGRSGAPPSLDPSSTASSDPLFWGIYDAMTRVDDKFNVVPHLASSWENNTSDNTEWIFHLNEAEWSDGTKMTAADVAFSHDYFKNPDNGSRLISRVKTVESARVIDDQTVAIKTSALDPLLPRRAMFVLTIPKHIFEDSSKGHSFQAQNGIGTGSYVAKSFSPAGYELEASPTSWHGNRGFTTIKNNHVEEQTTRLAGFETGDLDIINGVPTAEFTRVSGFSGVSVGAPPSASQLGWDIEYFDGPTADPRVRRAIAHSLDVQSIVDVIWFGQTIPMDGQIAPRNVFGYTPDLKPYGFDPDESRRLLTDAGFPNGFDIDFEFVSPYQPETKSFAEASAGFMNDVGIGTNILPVELNVWRDGLYGNKKRAPIHYSPWSAFAGEASFAMTWYTKDNPGKFYDNAEWEANFNAAIQELDDEKRRQLYGEASKVAFEDPPAMWTLESINLFGWRPEVVAYAPRLYPDYEYGSLEPA